MLEGRVLGVRFRISLLFPALVTGLLLCQPDGLAVTCLLASLIHELGHLLAMLLFGVPPESCTVGAFGFRIRLGERLPGYGQNILISLAGPLFNVISSFLLFWLDRPYGAVVHLTLAVLNLLPAAALDGGEILRCGLCLLGFEPFVRPVLRLTSAFILVPLAAVSVWLFLQGSGNSSLIIVSVYLTGLVFFSEKYENSS